MVKDATADYLDEEMHAVLDVNFPSYANAMVTTDEIVDSIASIEISISSGQPAVIRIDLGLINCGREVGSTFTQRVFLKERPNIFNLFESFCLSQQLSR